jgi:hypothetical protein
MATQPARANLIQATRAARTALGTAGLADVRHVASEPATAPGYPHGTVCTTVVLYPHHDRDRVIAALRALPNVVDLWSTANQVIVFRSATPTTLGPGGRDGLTAREAVRQSRLIHPDWTPAVHLDWLLDDGYPLPGGQDRAAAEAMLAEWLAHER